MKRFNFFMMLFSLLFTLCGCAEAKVESASPQNQSEVKGDTNECKKLSAEEASRMMGETTDVILLDVRTEDEFKEQRIDGAILIPDYEIADRAEAELPDKAALIFVYCRSGRRSESAANELVGMGYMNVYDLGGIIDWPYETVSD